jgi:hypothetical protein
MKGNSPTYDGSSDPRWILQYLSASALPRMSFEFHSLIFLNRSLILLKPLIELQVLQGPWPHRWQERSALEVVPQEQQDHMIV